MIKHFILNTIAVFASALSLAQSLSSSVVSSSGDFYENSTASLSITIGEPVIEFYHAAGGSLYTGFQQPYPNNDKLLSLVLFLEGLMTDDGIMNKTQGLGGDQFQGNIADKITIRLSQAISGYPVKASFTGVDLNTDGSCSFPVSGNYSGSYYLSVISHNGIETWSAAPISFSGSNIAYNFSDNVGKAYGNNLKLSGSGKYCLFSGDANQDGRIDNDDIITIGNQANVFGVGYLKEDMNGDGVVDALDLIITDNNAAGFVSVKKP